VTQADLVPAVVEPLLAGRLGRPYRHERVCSSTQDLLRDHALPEGAAAVAEHQTRGRGRSGRRWHDAPGDSLLVSILLRPQPARPPAELSLVCALSVAEAVEQATGLATGVKWPNDVLLEGRKVAGILLEGNGDAVIAGIGVNVNQLPEGLPAATPLPAGSLRLATGRAHDRAALLVSLLVRLEARYDEWRASGPAPIAAALEGRNWLRGRRVETAGGAGTAGSIRADGLLEVQLAGGEILAVASGEVTPAS